MKAKEKAEELVNKYNSLQRGFYKDEDPSYGYAKLCANIVVDEIIINMNDLEEKGKLKEGFDKFEFWLEVKKEIENL